MSKEAASDCERTSAKKVRSKLCNWGIKTNTLHAKLSLKLCIAVPSIRKPCDALLHGCHFELEDYLLRNVSYGTLGTFEVVLLGKMVSN